jgi:hypothetical protein
MIQLSRTTLTDPVGYPLIRKVLIYYDFGKRIRSIR